MKKAIQITVGLLLSALFAYLAVKDIQWDKFFETLRTDKQWWYLLPAVIAFMYSYYPRAIRWGYFLEPIKKVDTHPLFSGIMIGYMGNNVLPMRLGEFLRAYSLNRSTGISKSAGLATVVVERLVDSLGMMVFLLIAIFFSPIPTRYRMMIALIGLVSFGALSFLVGMTFFEKHTTKFLDKIYSILPEFLSRRMNSITQSFIEGLAGLKQTHNYWKIIFQTLVIWTFFAISTYFMLLAFNFDDLYGMGFISGIVVFLIGALGVVIPSSPGYVGTFHYVIIQALAIFGVPNEAALGFAIVIHLMNYLPVTFLGLFYFIREGFRFKEIQETAEQEV